MEDAASFESYRPLMFAIAYRMLGSVSDAEDIVQEAYLRYQAVPPEQIISLKAFLSTIVTRLCLNQLQRAQTTREQYIGPWLPEPILTDQQMLDRLALHESLTMAFLVLLEQLTPLERAVFLLREVFDYSYGEIAAILEKEEAACRQVFSRAKKHIAERRPRFTQNPDTHRQMLTTFLQAVQGGSFENLLQLLSDDVQLWADGGGKVRGAIRKPLYGAPAVARFILASPRLAAGPLESEITEVNGEPALILRTGNTPHIVLSITTEKQRITLIRVVGNPEKLMGLYSAA